MFNTFSYSTDNRSFIDYIHQILSRVLLFVILGIPPPKYMLIFFKATSIFHIQTHWLLKVNIKFHYIPFSNFFARNIRNIIYKATKTIL